MTALELPAGLDLERRSPGDLGHCPAEALATLCGDGAWRTSGAALRAPALRGARSMSVNAGGERSRSVDVRGQLMTATSKRWSLLLPYPAGLLRLNHDRAEFRMAFGLAPDVVIRRAETRWVAQVDHPMSPLVPRRITLRLTDDSFAPVAFSPPWWRRTEEVLRAFEDRDWPVNRDDVALQSTWHRQRRAA